MKFNPLLIAISSAAIALSSASALAVPVNKIESQKNTLSALKQNQSFTQSRLAVGQRSTTTDFSNPAEKKRSIERLKRFGITKDSRPYLFSLMERQASNDSLQRQSIASKSMALKTTSLSSETDSTDCNQSPDAICSFFINTGFSIKPNPNKPEDLYLVASALNSETLPTNYTLVDLALMNENFEYITTPNFVEYYGDGGEGKKRKAIETYDIISQAMRDKVAASERLIADAWITVVKVDENGKEVMEESNMMLDYSKESLLELLDEYLAPEPTTMKLASLNVADDPEPAPRSKDGPSDPNHLNLISPIDHRSKDGDTIKDNKITICLNRNYGDCDYENVYGTGTPNDKVLLKIPFEGSLKIPGQVVKLYKSTDTLPNENIKFATDIFVQMKEIGGGLSINDSDFSNLQDMFANNIVMTYFDFQGNEVDITVPDHARVTKTQLNWNLPRDTTTFGNAQQFGRYEDAHWIQHIVADVKFHPRRPATTQLFVIGSDDPYSLFKYIQPPMQFVYSCLAEGSMITMANGEKRSIESLTLNDTVLGASEYNPDHTLPLSIQDISVGVETIPMIEITTQSGLQLLLTESHPVITIADQPVWAKRLKQGDLIQTVSDSGAVTSDRITAVKTVDYDKNVYNLRLSRLADDAQNVDRDESFVMIANNMMVGDLGMQSENEFESVVESTEDVLNRIPSQWHQDFMNSQQ